MKQQTKTQFICGCCSVHDSDCLGAKVGSVPAKFHDVNRKKNRKERKTIVKIRYRAPTHQKNKNSYFEDNNLKLPFNVSSAPSISFFFFNFPKMQAVSPFIGFSYAKTIFAFPTAKLRQMQTSTHTHIHTYSDKRKTNAYSHSCTSTHIYGYTHKRAYMETFRQIIEITHEYTFTHLSTHIHINFLTYTCAHT